MTAVTKPPPAVPETSVRRELLLGGDQLLLHLLRLLHQLRHVRAAGLHAARVVDGGDGGRARAALVGTAFSCRIIALAPDATGVGVLDRIRNFRAKWIIIVVAWVAIGWVIPAVHHLSGASHGCDWTAMNTTATLQPDGSMDVVETESYDFGSGCHGGTRVIKASASHAVADRLGAPTTH
jgi:hypothetical protein